MSGGLLQLAALGAQDVYLTGNPEITLFKNKYHRYTHFATETIQLSFDGGAINFGSENISTITVDKIGDLISKIVLVLNIEVDDDPNIEWGYVNKLGHAIIDSIAINIGQAEIDNHDSEWINISHDLFANKSHEKNYNKMIGNTGENKAFSKTHKNIELFIPLDFWFCKSTSSTFPICCIQKQTFQIQIKLKNALDCINYKGDTPPSVLPSISDGYVLIDYIFLDNEERNLFLTNDHEYLIEQVQEMTEIVSLSESKINLVFDKACKYLIWTVTLNRYLNRNEYISWAHEDNWTENKKNFAKIIWLATREGLNIDDVTNPYIELSNSFNNIGESIPIVSNGLPKLEELVAKIKGLFLFATEDPNDNSLFRIKASPENVVILENNLNDQDVSLLLSELKASLDGTSQIQTNQSIFLDTFKLNIIDRFNTGNFINRNDNPIVSSKLQLNGKDRVQERDGHFFNYLNPYYYFTNTPADGINTYTFSMAPSELQPSGTINFTNINTKELVIKIGKNNNFDQLFFNEFFTRGQVKIYTVNYATLKVSPSRDLVGLVY